MNGIKGFQLFTVNTQYFKESVVIRTPNVKHVEGFQLTITILICKCNLFTQITAWKITHKYANEIFFNCRWAICIVPLQRRSSAVAIETTCHDVTVLHRPNTAVTTLPHIDTLVLTRLWCHCLISIPLALTPLDVTAVTFSQTYIVHSNEAASSQVIQRRMTGR